MPAGRGLPVIDRALVELVGDGKGRRRTAVGQQRDHLADEWGLVLTSIKRGTGRCREGLQARVATEAFFFLAMKPDIVLIHAAVQRAVGIGAERLFGVHG